jgi:hypothetical protein
VADAIGHQVYARHVLPPVPTRLSLLSPEIAVAADPARLQALLAACGAPALAPRVTSGGTGKERLATARALWGRSVPLPLAETLNNLARLATPSGRDALVEAARDLRMEPDWNDESPVDLAARLLADPVTMGAVLLRAQLRLARLPVERATYELRAASARPVPKERLNELGPALGRMACFEATRIDGWTDAWIHHDEESGDLHAVVLHEAASDGAAEVGREGPMAPRPPWTLRADAFHYHAAEARLAITPARPQRLEFYAFAWGLALYDDNQFFLREPSITLKPLQRLGAAGLAAAKLPPEIVRARVVACQLDTGTAHRVEARGPDALAQLGPQLRKGGHITRATLRFDILNEAHSIDVALQLPHRIDIGWTGVAGSGARGPRIAREALASLGLLSPGVVADDIATLLPLVHPEWRWRELVGSEGLAAMQAAGVLEPVSPERSRIPASPSFRHIGRSAIAYRLFRPGFYPSGRPDPDAPPEEKEFARAVVELIEVLDRVIDYYAVPDDWSLPAFTVRQAGLVALRLSLGALLRKARREMGLERGTPTTLPRGVHRIGEMRVEGGTIVFFYVVRAATSDRDRASLGRAISKAAGFGRPIVLVPRGRKLGRDFVELELNVAEQLGAASWRSKVAQGVRALGIEERVAPELTVPGDVRIVVDRVRERVVLDGVPLVKLGDSGYRLLRLLAERGTRDEVVPTRETDKAISGARASDGATRNTVWKMRGWIERSFAEARRELAADVKEAGLVRTVKGKGWTLTVKGVVI